MRERLSRRDRAAMELALAILRRDDDAKYVTRDAEAPLAHADDMASDLLIAMEDARRKFDPWGDPGVDDEYRVHRARLALALRVLLRVDRGDYGEVACERCGWQGDYTHEPGDLCGLCWQRGTEPVPMYRPRPSAPLWEAAPPWDGRGPRERREEVRDA